MRKLLFAAAAALCFIPSFALADAFLVTAQCFDDGSCLGNVEAYDSMRACYAAADDINGDDDDPDATASVAYCLRADDEESARESGIAQRQAGDSGSHSSGHGAGDHGGGGSSHGSSGHAGGGNGGGQVPHHPPPPVHPVVPGRPYPYR